MIRVLGVSVVLYLLFLLVLGILLFLYSVHGLEIEGFQAISVTRSGSGSGSGSGTFMSTPNVYVKDCTGQILSTGSSGSKGSAGSSTTATCVSIGAHTDRLTYLQRLPVGGVLVSSNGKYTLKYRPDGMLVLYDTKNMNILWSSNTKGTATDTPSYLRNIGLIDAVNTGGIRMRWIVTSASSGSGSGSAQSAAPSRPSPVTLTAPTPISESEANYSLPLNAATNTTIYLQVTDYGDLVILNSAGSTLWRSNTGDPPQPLNTCVPKPMSYPFTQADCHDLQNIISVNKNIINGISDIPQGPLFAETGANTYMPLYAYMFGIWILANSRPIQVSMIKMVGGIKIYIIETTHHLKMVADDSVGTARYFDTRTVTNWVNLATSWNDAFWNLATTTQPIGALPAGTRADGGYMLYLEGTPLQTAINPSAKPALVRTAKGRIISMYGDWILMPTTRKHPVSDVKNIGGVNIYISETFTFQNPRINMVADNAVGTAKYIVKTGNISLDNWNDSYWTTDGISAGVRSDGRCMIDKDEPIGLISGSASGSGGSGTGPIATSDVMSAKASICNLQPYYNDRTPDNPSGLGCAAYLVANPNPSRKTPYSKLTDTKGELAISIPPVSITASINNLSNEATTNADVRPWVGINDLIYFGYLLDIQGPFTVLNVTSSKITFTKKYIGPNLTNSILHVVKAEPYPNIIGTDVPVKNIPPDAIPVGNKEVYVFGDNIEFNLAKAETACATFGATVATYNQMKDAYEKGAHWCWYSIVKDDVTGNARIVFPIQTSGTCVDKEKGVSEITGTQSGLACYGIKPPKGTKYTIPGTTTQIPIVEFSRPYPSSTATASDAEVPTIYSASLITGSLYAESNYITTINKELPENLDIGDLIYISGPCNEYDTDLGNGLCRATDCKRGEIDTLRNNQCMSYKCRNAEGNQKTHVKNADGTCTVPNEYTPCPKTFEATKNTGAYRDISVDFSTPDRHQWGKHSVTEQSDGNICTYKVSTDMKEFKKNIADNTPYREYSAVSVSDNVPWTEIEYKIKQTLKIPSFNYDVIIGGVPDTLVTKTASNPTYQYPKTIGPFIVSLKPSINNILIRSYQAGDLDANGMFVPISSSGGLEAKATAAAARARNDALRAQIGPGMYTRAVNESEYALNMFGMGGVAYLYNESIKNQNATAIQAADAAATAAYTEVMTGTPAAEVARTNPVGDAITAGLAAEQLWLAQEKKRVLEEAGAIRTRYTDGILSGAEVNTALANYRAVSRVIANKVPRFQGRQNVQIYKIPYRTAVTPADGSSGSKISLKKNIIGCPAGTYGDSCMPCPPGQSSPIGSLTCSNCSAGYYCPGGTAAIACPAGKSSPASSVSEESCENCPAGKSTISGGVCTNCTVGYYCPGGRAIACPPGKSSPASSTSIESCTYCPPGQTTILVNGIFTPGSCTTCPVGYYCPSDTAAIPCDAGKSSPMSSTSANSCTPCPAGKISSAGGACTPCRAGQSSNEGGVSCFNCAAGKTSVEGGVCTSCDPGQSSVEGGSCTPCAAGYYCTGGEPAKPCSAGTYSYASATGCNRCPAGRYCPGGTPAINCPAGQSSGWDASECFLCPAGTSSVSGEICKNCDTGLFSVAGGLCGPCPAGTRMVIPQNPFMSRFCQQCPPNTFNNVAGRTSCTTCARNSYSAAGAAACSPCPAGQTSNPGGPCS